MFKLKKIFNKHNNAPELEEQNVGYDTRCERERIYFFYDGNLTHYRPQDTGEVVYYLSYGTVGEMDENRRINCFRVTPEMIFEVSCPEGAPYAGDKFILQSSEERCGFDSVKRVDISEESDGYFVNTDNWFKTKKVLVRLHCKQ